MGNIKKASKKRRVWLPKEEDIFIKVWSDRARNLRVAKRKLQVLKEMSEVLLYDYNCRVSMNEVSNKIHNLTNRYTKEKTAMLQTKIPTKWHLYSKVGKILAKLPNNAPNFQTSSPSIVLDCENDISKSSSIDSDSNAEDFVICRTCLMECKNYKSLYNYGIIDGEKTTLASLLTFCTDLQLSEGESPNLPSYICKKCIGELTRSYFFKKKVLDADNLLKSELNDNYTTNDNTEDQCNIKIEKLTDLNDPIEIKSEFSYDNEQFQNDNQNADDLIEYILQDDEGKRNNDDIIIDETDNIKVKKEGQDRSNVSELNFEKHLKVNSNSGSKAFVKDILIERKSTEVTVIICKVCGKQFRGRNFYASHMQLHSHSTLYKCKICNKSFKTSTAYEEHKSKHKTNICKICGKSFKQLINLTAHLKLHAGETDTFSCEICDKKFMRKWGYKMHMLTHNGEKRTRAKPYACDICGKGFYNYQQLFSHRENHLGLRKFKCTKCYQRFPNAEKLKRHMRMHKESLLCHICCQTFTRETTLSIHLRSCRTYQS